MSSFKEQLIGCFSSIAFYSSARKFKVIKAFFFFLITSLVLISAGWAIDVYQIVPRLEVALPKIIDQFVEEVPAGMTLTWDDNRLSASPEKFAYRIPFVRDNPFFDEYQFTQDSIVVNTTITEDEAHESVLDPESTTLLLLSKDAVYSMESTTRYAEMDLPRSFSINREMIVDASAWIVDQLNRRILVKIGFVLWPLVALVVILVRVLTVFLVSLVMYLLLLIFSQKYKYSSVFKITLYAIVPAQVIELVGRLVLPANQYSFLSLSLWVILAYVFVNLKNQLNQESA